jgi:hypothetical protein
MFYEVTQMYAEDHSTVFLVKVYLKIDHHELMCVDQYHGAKTFKDAVAIARLLIDRRRTEKLVAM